jgi:hypothetical protein
MELRVIVRNAISGTTGHSGVARPARGCEISCSISASFSSPARLIRSRSCGESETGPRNIARSQAAHAADRLPNLLNDAFK